MSFTQSLPQISSRIDDKCHDRLFVVSSARHFKSISLSRDVANQELITQMWKLARMQIHFVFLPLEVLQRTMNSLMKRFGDGLRETVSDIRQVSRSDTWRLCTRSFSKNWSPSSKLKHDQLRTMTWSLYQRWSIVLRVNSFHEQISDKLEFSRYCSRVPSTLFR